MSTLATLAFNRDTKVTKKRAMHILATIQEQGCHTTDELAELYSYFKPSTPSKPKSVQEWVCKAMGTKDVRFYLNRMEVTADGVMVCTDGHRLHIHNGTDLEPGAYDNQFNKIHADKAGTFPDWKRVIPRHTMSTPLSKAVITQHLTSLSTPKGAIIHGNWIDLQLGDMNIRLTSKYWAEAISMFPHDSSVVSYGTAADSILITGPNHFNQAVIMPIRPDKK